MGSNDGAPRLGEILVGKYVLRERIGEGGMGLVFLADQPALQRRVAIKILRPKLAEDEAFARRFHDEAVAASRVPHPGVVTIFDYGTTAAGSPFIAMAHVPGRLLGRVIAEDDPPLPRALALAGHILRTLAAVHAAGVVHADVKSDNVLVERTAEGEATTLIDFGLARLSEPWSRSGAVSGTPEYMAPELVRGEPPTIASDLYGAGVILYELLTGRRPFEGRSTDEILTRQLHEEVVPPSARRPDREIPPLLDAIVLRALHKDPRARFASAGELAHALEAVPRPPEAVAAAEVAAAAAEVAAAAAPPPPPTAAAAPPPPPTAAAPPPTAAPPPPPPPAAAAEDAATHPELRAAVLSALERGDAPGIADAYTALAEALVHELQLGAAITELEAGLGAITAGAPARTTEADRLAISLGALYERAGQHQLARRVLAATERHATIPEIADPEDPPQRSGRSQPALQPDAS